MKRRHNIILGTAFAILLLCVIRVSYYSYEVSRRVPFEPAEDGGETEVLAAELTEPEDIYAEYLGLPLLVIETDDGTEPAFRQADEPEGYEGGGTITDNKYVGAYFSYYNENGGIIASNIKSDIRVRGNSSALESEKVPYKLRLRQPCDMLGLGEEYADTEWVLLKSGNSMNILAGSYVSEYVGMEWTPRFSYVNVLLNGDYRGIYALAESVKRSPVRLDISEQGYIFENDMYFWNEDIYFLTDYSLPAMGYTIKYPMLVRDDDPHIDKLKSYVQSIEEAAADGDEELFSYIDRDSFVTWLMVQDLIGNEDAVGSNIFYYVDSIAPEDMSAAPLRIGPVWDMDTAFNIFEVFSAQHQSNTAMIEWLLCYPEFVEAYDDRWLSLRDGYVEGFIGYLEAYYDEHGEAMERAREMEAERYGCELQTVREELDYMIWFETNKTDSLNELYELNGYE